MATECIRGIVKGKLCFKDIRIKEVLIKTVARNNKTSSKVYMPKELENKTVYIIIPEKTRRRKE